MPREREDVRLALELLLTPRQRAYVAASRGHSQIQRLRSLVEDGIRLREAQGRSFELWHDRIMASGEEPLP